MSDVIDRRKLSPTHINIILHLANTGLSNKELASALGMNKHTLMSQLEKARLRVGVRTREQLIIWMWKHGEIVEMADGTRRIGIRLSAETL